MEQLPTSELELRDYLSVLKRRHKVVILTVVLVVGAGIVASVIQQPIYAASSKVLIRLNQAESPFDQGTGYVDPARSLATEIEILRSQLVAEQVRGVLGSAPPISARAIGETDVVQITAQSSDPKRAALVANTYAKSYIEVRRKQAVDNLLAAGEQIQDRITTLQEQITALDRQVAVPPTDATAVARDSLSEQRLNLVQQQGLFKQTLDKLTVTANLATGGVQPAGDAVVPTVPVKPRPMRTAVLAAAVGLMLGVGLAFLAEYLDDSIKTREDLERLAAPVPVIGVIPAVGGWKERDQVRLVSLTDAASPSAEAYRTLRTAIQFVALDRPMGIVQVTSTNASEGKTTTLANLGVALAKAGQRVILVCCDLRRPRLHEFFGLSNEVGFTSMLLGNAPISRALQPVPGVPRLRMLASGPLPPNPSELLASGRTKEVFIALKGEADIVLIDCPPVLPVTDALVLFRHVDATLMVFSAGTTTQKHAATAIAMAQQMNAPLVGMVLNGVPTTAGYASQYAYGYQSEPPKKETIGRSERARRQAAAKHSRKGARTAPPSRANGAEPLRVKTPNGEG